MCRLSPTANRAFSFLSKDCSSPLRGQRQSHGHCARHIEPSPVSLLGPVPAAPVRSETHRCDATLETSKEIALVALVADAVNEKPLPCWKVQHAAASPGKQEFSRFDLALSTAQSVRSLFVRKFRNEFPGHPPVKPEPLATIRWNLLPQLPIMPPTQLAHAGRPLTAEGGAAPVGRPT